MRKITYVYLSIGYVLIRRVTPAERVWVRVGEYVIDNSRRWWARNLSVAVRDLFYGEGPP